jgi:hypothetical protein
MPDLDTSSGKKFNESTFASASQTHNCDDYILVSNMVSLVYFRFRLCGKIDVRDAEPRSSLSDEVYFCHILGGRRATLLSASLRRRG